MAIDPNYQEYMRKEHLNEKWGSTGYKYSGASVLRALKERPYIRTVLDFGCGKGTMKPFLLSAMPELEISEYDPGIPGKDTVPTGQFDMVLSSDVLEHVEPHLLKDTIKQMAKLTKYALLNDIACYATGHVFPDGPYEGEDLHLTVEEPSWWRQQFELHCPLTEAEYQHKEKASNKGRRPRCLLIHERC